ncbi:MAG: hypothetical protein GYB64_20430 [Chloroflexi bacterium]|nr:hypothetical protein [Chloroflexota bacterium]
MPQLEVLQDICTDKRDVDTDLLERVLMLAVEIAREGREGRKIGTMFVVGDEAAVLDQSRPLVLDPLAGHAADVKQLNDTNMWETIKEFAQLDGAFVIAGDGTVLSAARYINASASTQIELPLGLGSRHMAGASISLTTDAVAVVVSESSIVRVFDDGEMVAEIIPEVWMLRRLGVHIEAPYIERREGDLTVRARQS